MNNHKKPNILLVDDEVNALKALSAFLGESRYNVCCADRVNKAKEILARERIDAVVTDIKMPDKDGLYLFNHIKSEYQNIPVIFLTAFGTLDTAVMTMSEGAFFYFVKPPDYVKLKGMLAKAVEQKKLKDEVSCFRGKTESTYGLSSIIGKSPGMQDVFKMVESVKNSSISVLIGGETGTGKDMLAKAIHYSSQRHLRPYVAVNCAAIPHELLEAELFGYEKGSFTGAIAKRIGKFEEAQAGTLFLDEIGELSLPLQAKLLRAIQEKEIERVGGNQKIKTDFRLIAATNSHLAKEVEAKRFRVDLYYRLNVVQITLPPLRNRRSDIPLLVVHFIDKLSQRENKDVTEVSSEVMSIFLNYSWPGNLRELENVIERALVLTRQRCIGVRDIPDYLRKDTENHNTPHEHNVKPLKQLELETITHTIKACNGNKSKAARALGVTRKVIYSRLRDLDSPLVN
jgi:DNA-binding NtrC family response regulator